MEKKVFLELTKEENLKKLNIDSRLVDSFKRVMIKIQQYFDSHGYSDMVDWEAIINEYLLPQEVVDKDAVRQSEEFINELKQAKDSQRKLASLLASDSSFKLEAIDDEQFLSDYIKRKYMVGLSFELEHETEKKLNGIYKGDLKTITLKEYLLLADSDSLDKALCHEFIHFLTMCGKDKIGSVSMSMPPAIYEPLTEMLASEIIGIQPEAYIEYCEIIKYINMLVGVDDYQYFIKRQLDSKYEEMSVVFEELQYMFDTHRYHEGVGYLGQDELINVLYRANTQLVFRVYDSINQLTDDMVKIYSTPNLYSNVENLERLQEVIVDLYITQNNINPEVKEKIMQLIRVKNDRRLINNMSCINLNIDGDTYLVDESGNLYLKRLNMLIKLEKYGTLMSYEIVDGVLKIYTEASSHAYDLRNGDFASLRNGLANQQAMLEKQIDALINGENISYGSDIVSIKL